jgi:signal transduction histidine kinase
MVGAARMTRLVDDLMDAARIQAGEPLVLLHEVDYGAVATDVIEGFAPAAAAAGIALVAEVGPVAPCALDAGRVAQVLRHLLDNALKFTPGGGRVLVRIFEIGGFLVTEVSDTGPGLPHAFAERAFRRFEQLDMGLTRTAGGTGLGLALARALVEAHGGSIGAVGEAGEGATFWFTLPMRS